MRVFFVGLLSLFVAGCFGGPATTFSTNSTYLVASQTHDALTVKAGGLIDFGDDVSENAFAILQFHSLGRASEYIFLCGERGRMSWYTVPRVRPGQPLLASWFGERKERAGQVSPGQQWLQEVIDTVNVQWSRSIRPTAAETVIASHLSGPKGTVTGSQIQGEGVVELSRSMMYNSDPEWVESMLGACS